MQQAGHKNELMYRIGITLIHGIGDVGAKNLMAYCGSAEAVFREKKKHFLKIPGIAEKTAEHLYREINDSKILVRAEKELQFVCDERITPLFYTDQQYPRRLKHFNDSPVMLYYKGEADLNAEKIISVVGTRTPTSYGKKAVSDFVSELRGSGILVLSGLAYGIDVMAHKTALDNDLDTVGVLGHGLDMMYPQVHDTIARKMLKQGGLLTEFTSGTKPDRENFPRRNRIVAGMCDALVIIESKIKGGSLITAEIANSYNKDVFAFPGRSNDEFSGGCNGFIKRNKAALIESAADLLYAMRWEDKKKKKKTDQIPLSISLTEQEQALVNTLKEKSTWHIDEICHSAGLSMSEASGLLLQLEFSNMVKSLPGKVYTLN